jgi:anti-sigma factor (TIGR02949 family)
MRHADHSCSETQEKIQLLIDGELDRHSVNEVQSIIDRCPFCKEFYHRQQQFRTMLHVSLRRKSCGEQLKTNVMNKIRGIR